MATVESYDTAHGKRYQVRDRTPQRTQTKKRGFKTKRDAQEFASTVEVEKMTGRYVAPSLGLITVGELAPAWLTRKDSDVAPSNYRMLESAWRIHVQPAWGATRIADIELNAVEQWIARVGRKSGATTVLRSFGVFAGILDDAVKARRLASARYVPRICRTRPVSAGCICRLMMLVGWPLSRGSTGRWW